MNSIGDIAIAPGNPDILYVGTGESNNRQSTTSGRGVYKSTDAGKTFALVGLEDTHHISRIVVDPKDPNVVYVAAMGHLFGPNTERGIFKTIDGGKTWTNTKFVDQNTGFTDVATAPSNNRVLYAASYQRQRTSWGFNGGGPGSGIWKTIDAGKTWTRLEGNGLPAGPFGRIGLAVFAANTKIVYAQIEVGLGAAAPATAGAPGAQAPGKVDPRLSGVWRSDDAGKTWRVMSNTNNRPMYYSQIRVDPANPDIVYTMGAHVLCRQINRHEWAANNRSYSSTISGAVTMTSLQSMPAAQAAMAAQNQADAAAKTGDRRPETGPESMGWTRGRSA